MIRRLQLYDSCVQTILLNKSKFQMPDVLRMQIAGKNMQSMSL